MIEKNAIGLRFRAKTRTGRVATRLILQPNADVSDPESISESDYDPNQSIPKVKKNLLPLLATAMMNYLKRF